MKGRQEGLTVDGAFADLETVRTRESRWQTVFDPTGTIAFRTVGKPWNGGCPFRTWMSIQDIDYSCHPLPLSLDLGAPLSGRVSGHLRPLDPSQNTALLQEAFESFLQFAGLGPDIANVLSTVQMDASTCLDR